MLFEAFIPTPEQFYGKATRRYRGFPDCILKNDHSWVSAILLSDVDVVCHLSDCIGWIVIKEWSDEDGEASACVFERDGEIQRNEPQSSTEVFF